MEFSPFPIAYGSEDEQSIRNFGISKAGGSHYSGEPFQHDTLQDMLHAYRNSHEGDFTWHGRFDTTGAAAYVDCSHLELVTAECPTPADVAARLQHHEILAAAIIGSYLKQHDYYGEIGIQRRSVDAYGNTVGLHDNFGFTLNGLRTPRLKEANFMYSIKSHLVSHLASRSFITGAGLTHPNRPPSFGQKAHYVNLVERYGTNESMLRTSTDEGGIRVEVRCNDINLNAWATTQRIGGAGISLALAQVPEGRHLRAAANTRLRMYDSFFKRFNTIPLLPDGSLSLSNKDRIRRLNHTVDFQEAETACFLADAMEVYDPPAYLTEIAMERLRFIDDFRRYMKGDVPLSALADRADWAAKFDMMQRYFTARPHKRLTYRGDNDDVFSSIEAERIDMQYDLIRVIRDEDGTTTSREGFGFKHRRNHAYQISDAVAAQAGAEPPAGMRGVLRQQILRSRKVLSMEWRQATVADGAYEATIPMRRPDRDRPSGPAVHSLPGAAL